MGAIVKLGQGSISKFCWCKFFEYKLDKFIQLCEGFQYRDEPIVSCWLRHSESWSLDMRRRLSVLGVLGVLTKFCGCRKGEVMRNPRWGWRWKTEEMHIFLCKEGLRWKFFGRMQSWLRYNNVKAEGSTHNIWRKNHFVWKDNFSHFLETRSLRIIFSYRGFLCDILNIDDGHKDWMEERLQYLTVHKNHWD